MQQTQAFSWLALYCFIFIIILIASPREIFNSDHDVDYRKVGWYALLGFLIIALVFFIFSKIVRYPKGQSLSLD